MGRFEDYPGLVGTGVQLLEMCFSAGVSAILCFGMGVTLRSGDRQYFYAALDRHFPDLKEKYIEKFGNAYECLSDNNDFLVKIFREECKNDGVMHEPGEIFSFLSEFPQEEQIRIFDNY